MKNIKYLMFTLCAAMFFTGRADALMFSYDRLINSGTPTVVTQHTGDLTCTSSDENIFTIDNDGVITPVADGVATATCSDDAMNQPMDYIININGTYTKGLMDEMNAMSSSIDVGFTKDFALNKDNKNIVTDYVYAGLEQLLDSETIHISEVNVGETSVSFKLEEYRSDLMATIKTPIAKIMTINYRASVASEKALVDKAKANLKPIYYAYLNDIYADLFEMSNPDNQKIMLDATNLKKDIGYDLISYEMDTRKGDDSLESPMFGGYLILKVNGTIYDVKEIEIRKAIVIPTVATKDEIISSAEKFFRENLIGDDEDVVVTEGEEEETYIATVTQKEEVSLVRTIFNSLMPTVNALDEKIISFMVIQDDNLNKTVTEVKEEVNPKTGDNILVYVTITFISALGLCSIASRKKVNE